LGLVALDGALVALIPPQPCMDVVRVVVVGGCCWGFLFVF